MTPPIDLLRRVRSHFHDLPVDTGFSAVPKDPARHWDHRVFRLVWENHQPVLYTFMFSAREHESPHRHLITYEEFDAHYEIKDILEPAPQHRLAFDGETPKYLVFAPKDFGRLLGVWDGVQEYSLSGPLIQSLLRRDTRLVNERGWFSWDHISDADFYAVIHPAYLAAVDKHSELFQKM